jgi:hypothetical protein
MRMRAVAGLQARCFVIGSLVAGCFIIGAIGMAGRAAAEVNQPSQANQVNQASTAGAVNYDLFPGYGEKHGYPPSASYRAWIVNYRDNKYYYCVANYDLGAPKTPVLSCTLLGAFNPPLQGGPSVKTFQALGGPRGASGTEESLSAFFWQIDQATGQVQFCIPIDGVNCVRTQLP